MPRGVAFLMTGNNTMLLKNLYKSVDKLIIGFLCKIFDPDSNRGKHMVLC